MDERLYGTLKRIVKDRIGIDIDAYKEAQMRRRLENFVLQRAGADTERWLAALPLDRDTLGALRDMLTINVSEFFRDAPQFSRLETTVLPKLLAERPALSIWSAACSNGQEPYSIAMLLDEQGALARSRILATDFDRAVLEKARAGGPYVPDDVRNVTAPRLEKHFQRDGAGYRVALSLRPRVQFREHNLLSSPYGNGYDLIVCRNVLIYFAPEVKMQIIGRFWEALRPGGVMFIGSTEALFGKDSVGFRGVGGNFYEKTADARPQARAA